MIATKKPTFEPYYDRNKQSATTISKPQTDNQPFLKPIPKPPFPTNKPNPYAKPFSTKCFRCQQPGHRSNECPQRPAAHLVGEHEEESVEDEKNSEICEGAERTYGDEGELVYNCIVQKLLLSPKQFDISQRNSLSRTRCTLNGKVCEVIVDSGSIENIVFKTLRIKH